MGSPPITGVQAVQPRFFPTMISVKFREILTRKLPLGLLGLLSLSLTLLLHPMPSTPAQSVVPAGGYTILVEAAAQQVYEAFPDLPRANTYKRQSDGEVDAENTLISRLIRYHRDIRRRSTRFRFDWKLTLADYLGVNETISADRYPGFSSLQTSPLEGDRQLIEQLNRQQRQDLVDILAKIYRPRTAPAAADPDNPATQAPAPDEPAVVNPDEPTLSKPGDAQLLMP